MARQRHYLHRLIPALAGALLLLSPATDATAAHKCRVEKVKSQLQGSVEVKVIKVCPSHESLTEPAGSAPESNSSGGDSRCEERKELLQIPDEINFQCGFYIEQLDDPKEQLTPGRIRRALHSFEVPAPELVIQPPDGRTLVNFDTNFYTEPEVVHRRTTLLGQAIEFRIVPQSYRWSFGDGAEETTSTPGAPYPALDVTHRYLRTGTYRPRLSTTYDAEYRLEGGAWHPVPGTLTVTDAPQQLEAVTARPVLVAPDGD